MDKRHEELLRVKSFTDSVEKQVCLLLQNLQWDPKIITEKHPMVTCKCDSNHQVLLEHRDIHEKQCHLTKLGYQKKDTFLPDPVDADGVALIQFSQQEISEIIKNAAIDNPFFKREAQVIIPLSQGVGSQESQPLTAARLQSTYSADERRAIHDAVVNAAPFCHDLTGLDLLSSKYDEKESQKKSRLEILAELRNMKRRRAKYRVAPTTRNYSDVLRDVIKTQMDMYGEATRTVIKTEYGPNVFVSQNLSKITSENILPHGTAIKQERESPEPRPHTSYQRGSPEHNRSRSREKRYVNDRRSFPKNNYSSKERGSSSDYSRQSQVSRNTENRREIRNDDDVRRHNRDKYSSKERTMSYDDYQKNKSQEKSYNDSKYQHSRYQSDYSSRHKSNNESRKTEKQAEDDIQEIPIGEPHSYSGYARDQNSDRSRNKDHSHYDSKKKRSKKDRSEKHKRLSPGKVFKQERISPSSDNGESSRKRHRSRSREMRLGSKMRRQDIDNHSAKRAKEPRMFIKQERESP